jgi:hypothetical protein
MYGGSMGVSLTDTTVANTVTATISSSRVTALDTVGEAGRVTVLVDGQNKITSMTVATAVAVSLGGSAAGGHAFSTASRIRCSEPTPGFPPHENLSRAAQPMPIIWS